MGQVSVVTDLAWILLASDIAISGIVIAIILALVASEMVSLGGELPSVDGGNGVLPSVGGRYGVPR